MQDKDSNTDVARITPEDERIKEFRLKLQAFLEQINKEPATESIGNTPDGKARTMLISHVEMTLDEFFFGQWDTVKFKWQVISNEIVGSILLKVRHPLTGKKIKRTGAAAIQIMVDRVPDEIKDNHKLKNAWALNPENKKSGALDMGFPKLKAECTKNAANSLGKLLGRDLNRQRTDTFKGKVPKKQTKWTSNQQTTENGSQQQSTTDDAPGSAS